MSFNLNAFILALLHTSSFFLVLELEIWVALFYFEVKCNTLS